MATIPEIVVNVTPPPRILNEVLERQLAELLRLREREAKVGRVLDLVRDAVEAGAIGECYLSLLRDAMSALPNAEDHGSGPVAPSGALLASVLCSPTLK